MFSPFLASEGLSGDETKVGGVLDHSHKNQGEGQPHLWAYMCLI